jgi:hypothetical protein
VLHLSIKAQLFEFQWSERIRPPHLLGPNRVNVWGVLPGSSYLDSCNSWQPAGFLLECSLLEVFSSAARLGTVSRWDCRNLRISAPFDPNCGYVFSSFKIRESEWRREKDTTAWKYDVRDRSFCSPHVDLRAAGRKVLICCLIRCT